MNREEKREETCTNCPKPGYTYAVCLEDSIIRTYILCEACRLDLAVELRKACRAFDIL